MGVIRRQTLKYSAVNLTGLLIGAFSTLFIYPHALEAYGLVQVLLSVGMIGLPLFSLGANTVAIRFFPRFQDAERGHNGFLALLLALCMAGGTLGALFFVFFGTQLIRFMQKSGSAGNLLPEYFWMALPLAFFYVIGVVLSVYSSNFKRIVVPSLLLDFSQKIIVPVLLFALWQGWLALPSVLWGLIAHAFLVLVSLGLYLRWLGAWHWRPDSSYLSPALTRELLQFVAFGALSGFALQLASKVDIFMVGSMTALKSAGVYAIAAYIAAAIDIPTKGLYAASASSVARYLAENNHLELSRLYQKVSINLLVAGILLFGAAWASVDALFQIVPNGQEVSAGKYVLLLIGLSRIVEMGTGLNNYMVLYSKYYLYALLTLGLLAVANICLNLWLVPRLGINGAALATLISVSCYNGASVALVWAKFRLQPFSRRSLWVLLFGLVALGCASLLPDSGSPFVNILVRSGSYTLLFLGLCLRFRVSGDLDELAQLIQKRLRKR
jgi:O-antigen/teichoic acid export membrane protein